MQISSLHLYQTENVTFSLCRYNGRNRNSWSFKIWVISVYNIQFFKLVKAEFQIYNLSFFYRFHVTNVITEKNIKVDGDIKLCFEQNICTQVLGFFDLPVSYNGNCSAADGRPAFEGQYKLHLYLIKVIIVYIKLFRSKSCLMPVNLSFCFRHQF